MTVDRDLTSTSQGSSFSGALGRSKSIDHKRVRTSGQRFAGRMLRIFGGFMMIVAYPLIVLGLLALIGQFVVGEPSGTLISLGVTVGAVMLTATASLMFTFGSYLRGLIWWPAENQAATLAWIAARDVLIPLGSMTTGVGLLFLVIVFDSWLRGLIAVVCGIAMMFLLRSVLRTLDRIVERARSGGMVTP
jgi:hypothetical protein